MKRNFCLVIASVLFFFLGISSAQSPEGKNFGFGIILGDPTGGTAKFWTSSQNAFTLSLGKSYFGSPRIGVDYLWHFNPFSTSVANLYAGAGGELALEKEMVFGTRINTLEQIMRRVWVQEVFSV